MGGLHIFLLVLTGVFSRSCWVSGSVVERIVRPRDNVTIACDCKLSRGELPVWYRNCSHENQPTFMLKFNTKGYYTSNLFTPRFNFVKNSSSGSYDLLIVNITHSDEGFYFCGTEQTKVVQEDKISQKSVHRYGNITTRIMFEHEPSTPPDCSVCWPLLFSLCPALSALSSLLSSLLVYCICRKTAEEPKVDMKRRDTSDQTSENKSEDVCYAALEIRPASRRPKKQKESSSDFSTYSAINTSRV